MIKVWDNDVFMIVCFGRGWGIEMVDRNGEYFEGFYKVGGRSEEGEVGLECKGFLSRSISI